MPRAQPGSGGMAPGRDRCHRRGCRQAEYRHIGIDRLDVGRWNPIGLVKDSDRPIVPDLSVEPAPSRQMLGLRIAGVTLEVVERIPVLNQQNDSARHHGAGRDEKPPGRVLGQFDDHSRHSCEHRKPAPDLPEPVDPHPDQKDHDFSAVGQVRSPSAVENRCHLSLPFMM